MSKITFKNQPVKYAQQTPMFNSNKLSLNNKLIFLLISCFSGFILFTGFIYHATTNNTQLLTNIKEIYFPILEHAKANKERLESLTVLFQKAVETNEEDVLVDTHITAEKIRQSLLAIEKARPSLRGNIQRISTQFEDYYLNAEQISADLISQKLNIESNDSRFRKIGKSLHKLQRSFDAVHTDSYSEFSHAIQTANQFANRVVIICIFAPILFSLISIYIYFSLRVNILSPIIALIKSTDIIAGGNLQHKVPLQTKDEFGRLANSFNSMTDSLLESYNDLQEKNQELIAATKAKSAFLANTSHEIRTPLAAIIGFSEALLEDNLTEEERISSLHAIITGGTHLKGVINDILDLSKIEADKLNIDLIFTPLFELINDVDAIIKMQTEEKGLAFKIHCHFPLPETINTDPLRLKQILINIAGNATKFTDKGKISIDISYDHHTAMLKFVVSDTGIGVADEHFEKIFDVFAQSDDSISRKYGGTGLGLPLSKKLVQMLGGDLSLKSVFGVGSQFTFTINVGHINKNELINNHPNTNLKPQALTNSRSTTTKHRLRSSKVIPDTCPPDAVIKGNVLLAEDTITNQKLISLFLRKTAVNLTIVNNGKEAIDSVLSNQYDLILMDIQMPIMSGLDAIKLLHKNGCKIPIIAVTANALKHDIDNYFASGFDEVIPKPLTKNQLLATMFRYLASDKDDSNHVTTTDDSHSTESPIADHESTSGVFSEEFNQGLKNFSSLLQQMHAVYDGFRELDPKQRPTTSSQDTCKTDDNNQLTNNGGNGADNSPIISSIVDEDPEFLSLLSSYIKELSTTKIAVLNAVDTKQWDELKSHIHKVKGSAGAFGFAQLTKLAKDIQLLLVENSYDNIKDNVNQLSEVCDRIVDGHRRQCSISKKFGT